MGIVVPDGNTVVVMSLSSSSCLGLRLSMVVSGLVGVLLLVMAWLLVKPRGFALLVLMLVREHML